MIFQETWSDEHFSVQVTFIDEIKSNKRIDVQKYSRNLLNIVIQRIKTILFTFTQKRVSATVNNLSNIKKTNPTKIERLNQIKAKSKISFFPLSYRYTCCLMTFVTLFKTKINITFFCYFCTFENSNLNIVFLLLL